MDSELARQVRRFIDGDRDAAAVLARRAGDSALRTAVAALGDPELGRDVAQDVAVAVLRGIRSLRDPSRFDAWVHRITANEVIRAARTRARRRNSELALDAELLDREPSATRPRGIDVEAVCRRDAVRRAMTELTPQQRVAIALRYVHDLTEPEIAGALRCRPGTASAMLSRSRQLLRDSPHLRDFAPQSAAGGVS